MSFKTKVNLIYKVEAGPKDRYLQMFKGQEDDALPHVEWALKILKKDDRCVWFLKSYKADPAKITDKVKTDLEHFMSMLTQCNEIDKLKMDAKWDLQKGLDEVKKAEDECLKRFKEGNIFVPKKGEKIVNLGGGWGWWDTGEPTCDLEAKAMGHCGNSGSPHPEDKLLSLREEKSLGSDTYFQPHLTFILNHGVLGEMKGKANEKPKQKYHKAIIKLLESKFVVHVWGGGYEEGRNFSLDDLTQEEQEHLLKLKPEIDMQRHLDHIHVDNDKFSHDFHQHNVAIEKLKKATFGPAKNDPDTIDDVLDDIESENSHITPRKEKLTHDHIEELLESSDPEIREAAVRKTKNQDKIASIALDHKEKSKVREEAAKRLSKPDAINKLALDADTAVSYTHLTLPTNREV